jgi:alpha-tubulin suppressor-like RCC1 family protein
MALLNKDSLITQLKADAESATEADVFAGLTAALEKLTNDRAVSVATDNDLPDLYNDPLPTGSVFLVDSLNVLVISSGFRWLGLDGRLLRDDFPATDAMSWGYGGYIIGAGVLGSGDLVSRSSPGTVVGGITNWSAVSAGYGHSLGLTSSGVLYAWGENLAGILGDGTTINRSSPVTVVGGITDWSAISAGPAHNLGLRANGVLYAWGAGSAGRLGDETSTNKSSPVTVVGDITNWSTISVGRHSLGLTSSGVLYAWGTNIATSAGALGDGTAISRSSPVTVVGGITNWSQISAGSGHSLGLTNAGVLYAWGAGGFGRLGDGTAISRSSPVTVVGGITNWSQIDAGAGHNLALTDTGVLYAWGFNQRGQIGDGTVISRSSPVTVVGGITNWSTIIAKGDSHSLAFTDAGVLYAWGYNGYGGLGDGTNIDKSSPVTVVGGITSWLSVSAGSKHSLGVKVSV